MDRALLVALALSAGCLRDTTFHCTDDNQCGDQGKCELGFGFCSFPDTGCPDGRRFGNLSGDQADECVGSGSSGNCSADYDVVPGQTHLYKLADGSHNWPQQHDACNGDGGYLAIPDDQDELTALISLAANASQTFWIGVDDQDTEGTFLTVKGDPVSFQPWAPGEPNDSGGGGGSGADCVQVQDDGLFHDFRCGDNEVAICECEP